MRVLLTGAAGFFGRHFYETFLQHGDDVLASDITTGQDVRNIDTWVSNRHYDLVIHLAGNVGGRANIDANPLWIADNLAIDAAFFSWAARAQPGRVVYFSSAAAYPLSLQARGYTNKLTEDMVCPSLLGAPDDIYGWAKVTGELLATKLRAAGTPVTVVRPFSGYGPEQTLDYPFPSFIGRALRRDDPFTIWGDGTQTRDWIHAEDVIAGVLALTEQGVDGPVNLCTGRPTTMTDLATIVCDTVGYTPSFHYETDAPTGPHYRVGDPALLTNYYTPTVTVEEGVERAMA